MTRLHLIAITVLTGLVIVLGHAHLADQEPTAKVIELELSAPLKTENALSGYRPQYDNTPVQFVAPVAEPAGI